MSEKQAQGPLAIDLFAGAGGLSLGFSNAGFHIAIANDSEASFADTFVRNHPNTTFLVEDIRRLSAKELLRHSGIGPRDIDIVIGGPPCQGFSMANAQTRFLNNPNNKLFREFVRMVSEIRPKWFVLENVPGLVRMRKGKIKEEIEKAFQDLGYKVNTGVLCAADFGVPQMRKRILFIGNRTKADFEFPKPTHQPFNKWEMATKSNRYVVVDEAISDLPPLKCSRGKEVDKYEVAPRSPYQALMRKRSRKLWSHITTVSRQEVRDRFKHIPQGGNWSDIPIRLMRKWRTIPPEELSKVSHSSLYKRLHPAEPSITIANFRKSMILHPVEDRIISVREAARLQSFPDDFILEGSIGSQQQQIANAVPPLLAEAVAKQIMKYL